MLLTLEQLFAFAIAGTTVSLLLEYFPKLNTWFNGQLDNTQRLIVLGSGVVVVLGAFGFNCLEFLFELPWVCSWLGLKEAIVAFFVYIFATQGTYLVAPKKSNE